MGFFLILFINSFCFWNDLTYCLSLNVFNRVPFLISMDSISLYTTLVINHSFLQKILAFSNWKRNLLCKKISSNKSKTIKTWRFSQEIFYWIRKNPIIKVNFKTDIWFRSWVYKTKGILEFPQQEKKIIIKNMINC